MKASLVSIVFIVLLGAQVVMGEEMLGIVVEVSFANDELKERLASSVSPEFVSIELVRKDGDYDPLLVPVVVSDDGTGYSAEVPGDRVQNSAMTYLVQHLSLREIFRYYLGELKGGREVEYFSFDYHLTTITYDFSRWRAARDAVTTTGRMLGGWMYLVGEKHGFHVPLRMDESLKGSVEFLSLPTDKYEVNVKLYPRYSDVDTRTIEYDLPDPISFHQGERMEIIAK